MLVRETYDVDGIGGFKVSLDLGKNFARRCKNSGVDAAILFPQSGPTAQEYWIKACQDVGLGLIVGGEMTHPKYKRSEGGYITDEALDKIYSFAAELGVNNFVVPGNKPDGVAHYRDLLKDVPGLTFYMPGFITQGGIISEVVLLDREQGGIERAKSLDYNLYASIPFITKGLEWLKDKLTEVEYKTILDYVESPAKYQDPELQQHLMHLAEASK